MCECFRGDDINIHAHSSLLKNVSKLVKDTQVYLLAQPKLFITLEGVLSNTVHILLQFLYIGKLAVLSIVNLFKKVGLINPLKQSRSSQTIKEIIMM